MTDSATGLSQSCSDKQSRCYEGPFSDRGWCYVHQKVLR